MKNYKIAVAGTGYVGLSLGVLLSQHHQVVAVDIVQAKVDMINNKKSPIQDDYIEKYLAEKDLNLTATLDAKAAYVYGLLGAVVVVKWFYKLYKCAWRLYRDNIYWPLGFMIALTILLYNITFWWNKPSWTLGMIFLMCYMEHKLNDESERSDIL